MTKATLDKIKNITINELLEIKKIHKMPLQTGVLKMQKLEEWYGLNHEEGKELLVIARDFKV